MTEEIYRDIPGYEGAYQVSNLGNVRSLDRVVHRSNGQAVVKGRQLKAFLNSKGYRRISLIYQGKDRKSFVHRLVLLAFVGESDLTVDHINGIKTDNRLENLRYISRRENTIKSQTGSQCNFAKLNESAVISIRKKLDEGSDFDTLAQEFGVAAKTIWDIKARRTWKHLD